MNRLKSILFQSLLFVVFVSAPLLAESPASVSRRPKYIFLMIGDGMGFSHLQLTGIYRNNVLARQSELAPALVIPTLPATGIASTYSADSSITDSAAAGTALATGYKTNDGVVARSPDLKTDYESLAVAAKRKGMKSGILSSVSLDHATPAVFYAHQNSRKMYYEIAMELAKSDIDFFGGGGLLGDARRGKKPSPLETAAQSGFTVCVDKPAFDRLLNAEAPINTHKQLLLINPVLESEQAFEYEIDLRRTIDPARAKDHISLAAFTRLAITALDTPDGFFIMVEGGKIDWTNHSNDALTSIYEVLEFDAAVAAAIAFYQTRPAETLVVVTSDHETGGLTLLPSKTIDNSSIALLDKQRGSRPAIANRWRAAKASSTAPALDGALRFVYDNFGLWTEKLSPADADPALKLSADETALMSLAFEIEMGIAPFDDDAKQRVATRLGYGASVKSSDILVPLCGRLLDARAGVHWSTGDHSAADVPVFAIGAGAERFAGRYDNTEIARRLFSLLDSPLQSTPVQEKEPEPAAVAK